MEWPRPKVHMTASKTAAGVAAMLAVGVLGFWAFGEVVQARMHRPAAGLSGLSPTGRIGSPSKVLQQGLAESVQAAVVALVHQDSTGAAEAMDAAKRAAEVSRVLDVHERIQQARQVFQNGDPSRAQLQLEEALRHLLGAGLVAGLQNQGNTTSGTYKGATILNARGAHIGTVESVTADQAQLDIGGHQHFLGFIDRPGDHSVKVPISWLILGEQKTFGEKMVLLPILSSSIKDVEQELASMRHSR